MIAVFNFTSDVKILCNFGILGKISLIFFVYPDPMGSEENQFTPVGAGVNKLIFKLFDLYYIILALWGKLKVES
jgi:hypothetical protein